jgi:hypothetical protein
MTSNSTSKRYADPTDVNITQQIPLEKEGTLSPEECTRSLKVESYSFENIVNFRDVGESCSVKTEQGIQR